MTNQNRSAGYCVHCQRGVTVVRPSGNGFFGRVRSAITNNEDTWICSKCGNLASKEFIPPAEATNISMDAPPEATENQHPETINPVTTQKPDTPHFEINHHDNGAETFTVASGPEAFCHLCNGSIPFNATEYDSIIDCPGCQMPVILPHADSESLLTSSPAVIKLEDDPERPAISKSLCTLCQFEMTYPKKLSGKDVDCPSCSTHFQLP